MNNRLPIGIMLVSFATGCCAPTGGDVLYIETTLLPGSHEVSLTGQLGDVMKESASAALSYLRANADELKIDYKVFENFDLPADLRHKKAAIRRMCDFDRPGKSGNDRFDSEFELCDAVAHDHGQQQKGEGEMFHVCRFEGVL